MSEPEIGCIHIWVDGRVQGVGFRAFVQDCAQRLGVTGWVRNIDEDQVEVWAEGVQTELDRERFDGGDWVDSRRTNGLLQHSDSIVARFRSGEAASEIWLLRR